MKVVPLDTTELLELLMKQTSVRSPGLHMSDLYNDLFAHLEPKRFAKGDGPDKIKMGAGLALEAILENALRERYGQLAERPGELLTEDGITYSPDLIIFNGQTRVGEIKLTWMSTKEVPRVPENGFPKKFDKWICQMMCYGHELETPYARLIGFFVNGCYRPMAPELLAWDFEFSKREMSENWAMVMNHGRNQGLIP